MSTSLATASRSPARTPTRALRQALLTLVRREIHALALPLRTAPDDLLAELERAAPEAAWDDKAALQQVRTLAGLLWGHPGPDHAALLEPLRRVPLVVDVPGGRALIRFDVWRDLHLLASGTWEPQKRTLLETQLRPGDVALDVGAQVGFFSILAAHLVGRTGKVLSFEPAPHNLDRLRANLALNAFGRSVDVIPAAVGASVDNVCAQRGIQAIDFLKIDAEGAGLDVLKGARGILSRSPRAMLLIALSPWVCPPEQVLHELVRQNFRLRRVESTDLVTLDAATSAFARGGDVVAVR